eukprot:767983-Hanusia_phi.AAC.10
MENMIKRMEMILAIMVVMVVMTSKMEKKKMSTCGFVTMQKPMILQSGACTRVSKSEGKTRERSGGRCGRGGGEEEVVVRSEGKGAGNSDSVAVKLPSILSHLYPTEITQVLRLPIFTMSSSFLARSTTRCSSTRYGTRSTTCSPVGVAHGERQSEADVQDMERRFLTTSTSSNAPLGVAVVG